MNPYDFSTDEHLFSLLRKGDEGAFIVLYERYRERLKYRAALLLNSKETAEEIVNDIFVDLWKKRSSRDILHTFQSYVISMLKYKCYEIFSERQHLQIREMSFEMQEIPDFSTQQWLDYDSLYNEIQAGIARLPEKCGLIFRLKQEQGYSEKEIAQKLGVSVNTVHTQLYRALKKLKAALKFF